MDPGRGIENGSDIVPAHARDDDGVHGLGVHGGQTVGREKVHAVRRAELGGVGPGLLQGLFPEIRGDHMGRPAGLEQMDAQIAVVAAHVGHPGPGGHQIRTGQKPPGDGEFHGITSENGWKMAHRPPGPEPWEHHTHRNRSRAGIKPAPTRRQGQWRHSMTRQGRTLGVLPVAGMFTAAPGRRPRWLR